MEEKISKLAPSILSADFCKLGEQIHELEECDIELLHIDIMRSPVKSQERIPA